MRDPEELALWDVEDLSTFPAVRDMTVSAVAHRDVIEFCRRYHYSNTGGSNLWNWGLWHGVYLLGVVSYNLPTRSVCDSIFGEDHWDHVWHMGRLAVADEVPKNAESRLIGGSLRAIEKQHPGTWAIVTYAATDVGHIGYVYQATNALYTGTGGDPTWFIDQEGRRRGRYLSGHVSDARAASMGWEKQASGGPKHRYIYILGNKRERRERRALLRFPVLPYPKPVQPKVMREAPDSSRLHLESDTTFDQVSLWEDDPTA